MRKEKTIYKLLNLSRSNDLNKSMMKKNDDVIYLKKLKINPLCMKNYEFKSLYALIKI
jgi:hypothetical protein